MPISAFTERVLDLVDLLKSTKQITSDKQFALAINLDPGQLSAARQGKREIPEKYIIDICQQFGVAFEYLRTGQGDMFSNNAMSPLYSDNKQDKIGALRNVIKGVENKSRNKTERINSNIIPLDRTDDIPMYNFPGSASVVQMYNDELPDIQPVGQLRIPGAMPGSFALPVYGHSMYPTLENGNWCVLRPISDPTDIDYGEVYYIEYGDYRVYKRLLKADDDDESIILWSDNQSEVVNGRPKYASKKIRVERIRKLCILTEILKKPNY